MLNHRELGSVLRMQRFKGKYSVSDYNRSLFNSKTIQNFGMNTQRLWEEFE